MRLLDAMCGAGGASEGYSRAGFEVVGCDIVAQPNYPFEFVQADALEYLAEYGHEYDVIAASPPCQRFTRLSALSKREHPDLIEATRALLEEIGRPYVIENVPGAPLRDAVQLCGSSFGLGVRRHRLFECSFDLMVPPCAHGQQVAKYRVYEHGHWYLSPAAKVYGSGGGKAREQWGEAMGIDWMSRQELTQAIPPAYTEHIGGYLMAAVQQEARDAVSPTPEPNPEQEAEDAFAEYQDYDPSGRY